MLKRIQRKPFAFAFVVIFILYAAVVIAQVTNVLNPASDLSGRHLVTAEGSYSITGTMSWTVPVRTAPGTTGAPGIVSTADQATGWQLSSGSIGGSISGSQRLLLNTSGLTLFGTTVVNNSGNLQTAAFNSGSGATSSTFWRGDGTWAAPPSLGTVVGKTSSYSANCGEIVEFTSGSSITLTLPLASTCTSQNHVGLKNDTSNGAITVARTSSDTIDGATSFSSSGVQYESYDFVPNAAGNGWMIR